MKEGYIKKSERKNILFLADDCRIPSGIGTMTREIIIGNAHRFNFFQVGAAIKHPEAGQIFDLSDDVNKQTGIDDSCVLVYPFDGYGNPDIVRGLMDKHEIDAIIHFTDPRYWQWLYGMSAELRQRVPIIYYHIWDDLPAPHYNKPFYESCDLLMGISKQSNNIAKMVLGKDNYIDLDGVITKADVSDHRSKVCYIPHGVNTNLFFPVPYSDTEAMRGELFGKDHAKDVDFVVFHNNRNIRRKMTSDLILAFKLLYDKVKANPNITTEKDKQHPADKMRLLLHTDAIDQNGTDLPSVIKNVCPEIEHLVVVTNRKVSPQDLNIFYNIADVVPNIASNEGWGLSSTEAMVVGKPIVNNVTGGLQDQCRFEDENGKWIDFDENFGSNHAGRYKKHGQWVAPVFPSTISIQGSPITPYIFDDRCDVRDIADALLSWHTAGPDIRKEKGELGRSWAMSEEAGFTSAWMCQRIGDVMTLLMENWKPMPRFKLYDVQEEIKKTKNKPTGIAL
jgi:glycosyltransferase involved in cell wall biosynthesis